MTHRQDTSLAASWSRFLTHKYLIILGGILLFAAFWRLHRLSDPAAYIFDEVYHSVTAKLIARGDHRSYEWWNEPVEPNTAVDWLHPPLAKYTQAASMLVFGENSYGWRFSAAIFGILTVAATAKLALLLFDNKPLALTAALLASLDGLLLVQSRIAMNDIHVAFFILVTLICYVTYRHKQSAHDSRALIWLTLTGLCAGLAMSSKWSGLFVLLVVWIFESAHLLTSTKESITTIRAFASRLLSLAKQFSLRILPLFILPILVYILSYTHMFLQGKTLVCTGRETVQGECYCQQDSSWWVNILKKVSPEKSAYWESLEARGGCKRLISHFSELHNQIWWYQNNLKATHPYQSRPIEWFLNLRPVWMHVSHPDETHVSNIYSFGNTALFWIGDLAVLASLIAIGNSFVQNFNRYQTVSSRPLSRKKILPAHTANINPLILLVVAYLMMWLPWDWSPRIMFFYHYAPAVPLLCIMLAYWLSCLWQTSPEESGSKKRVLLSNSLNFRQYLVIAALLLITINYFLWLPQWTNIPVDRKFADMVYFAFPQWR